MSRMTPSRVEIFYSFRKVKILEHSKPSINYVISVVKMDLVTRCTRNMCHGEFLLLKPKRTQKQKRFFEQRGKKFTEQSTNINCFDFDLLLLMKHTQTPSLSHTLSSTNTHTHTHTLSHAIHSHTRRSFEIKTEINEHHAIY